MPLVALARFTLQHKPRPVVWGDRSGRLVYATEEMSSMIGLSRANLLRLDMTRITADCSQERWLGLWDALRRDKAIEASLDLVTQEDEIVRAVLSFRYFPSSGGAYFAAAVRRC